MQARERLLATHTLGDSRNVTEQFSGFLKSCFEKFYQTPTQNPRILDTKFGLIWELIY